MSFIEKFRILLLTIFIYICFTQIALCQIDSTNLEDFKLTFSPSVHCIQIDATSIILMNQIGGEFDFDILRSRNKHTCIGTRVSVEHYSLVNPVDKVHGSPFTNYNLYARISGIIDDLLFSVLGGATYYTTDDPSYLPSKYMFRTGFEIKYGSAFGFILKGSTSLSDKSTFIGFGIYLGYNHN
ncbi:MAG: hypothetical protein MUP85_07415 [Candidatus Lokiarchaeota archaeon]|nr:hypothetical protein [Candidatus Lokiarchaeota archaeon]